MIKLFISIFCFLFLFLQSNAQSGNFSTLECLYIHKYVSDTTAVEMSMNGEFDGGDSTYIYTEYFILRCGGPVSEFRSFDRMIADSALSYNEYSDLISGNSYNLKSGSRLRIYKDVNNITTIQPISFDWFRIVENIPDFGWEVCDEWKNVAGYNARMARCSFRGREYIVWFTSEIPVSEGPWKFAGLPGLIVEVCDVECEYYYRLISLRRKNTQIEFLNENMLDLSQEKFNKRLRMYIEDVVRYMSMTYSGPISYADKDGNPIDPESLKKVMKFDFEEIVF